MKQLITGICVAAGVFLAGCAETKKITPGPVAALKLYETLPDATEKKTLRGILTKDQITADTAFNWYAENLKYFKPDADAVKNIQAKADKISIVIFGGTWCHDTQQLLPKYLATLQAAGFPDNRLTLIGVDRAKTTVGDLQKPFNITNVPTVIVMKEGKEVGRIIEYGKTALVDKELGELVKGIE